MQEFNYQSSLGRLPKTTLRRLSLPLFLVVSALIADSGGVAADSEAGKNKAGTCAACHGENGISQTENTPSLAAQPDQFLQWQLVFFRSGARKNEIMAPIAEQLCNGDVRDLAAYFASLEPPEASGTETTDNRPGSDRSRQEGRSPRTVRLVPWRQFCRQQGCGADSRTT